MRFVVVTIGKSKHDFIQKALDHYVKSITTMAEIELVELKDQHGGDLGREGVQLLEWLEKKKYLSDGKNRCVVLDERGKSFTSVKWAEELKRWEDSGVNRVVFIVGGAYGVDNRIKEAAFAQLRLSDFTFPHDLARVVLLEQIYRALHIHAGSKYHHE